MSTDNLAQCIDAKLQVLMQLQVLARRQQAAIGENDFTSLLTILAGKQQLVNQLQELDSQLAPYQNESPAARRWSSSALRERCQAQAARCEAVLREILAAELQAEKTITTQRDATAKQLEAVNQSHRAQRSYATLPAPQTAIFDLTSEG